MCTFFSGSDHHPTRKHDGIPDWGPLRPPAGPHPCCAKPLATLELGGAAVRSPSHPRTTGGVLLLQTIDGQSDYPAPSMGCIRWFWVIVCIILLSFFNDLMLAKARPHWKYMQRAPQFRTHTGKKKEPKNDINLSEGEKPFDCNVLSMLSWLLFDSQMML